MAKKKVEQKLKGRFISVSLPKKYADFLKKAIPLRGQELIGPEDTHGRSSAYIVRLIMNDLYREGYFNKAGEPVESRLSQAKKTIDKKLETSPWFDAAK